jgi:hypothetical protein
MRMPILKLILDTVNFKWALRFFIIFGLLLSLSPLAGFAQPAAKTDTTASLVIAPANFSIVVSTFTIAPSSIYQGDNLVFTLNPVTYQNGGIAANLPCRMTLTAPDSSVVIIDGVTSVTGTCVYDTALSLASQGLILVSGDITKLNSAIGNGSGFATVTYNSSPTITNTAIYQVKAKTLLLGQLTINPKLVNINGNLVFQLDQVKFIDNTIGANLPAVMVITTPRGTQVVLSGYTDNQGRFTFDTSKPLSAQGLTLVSGNLNDVNGYAGGGQAYARVVYNGITYTSNTDTYGVSGPVIIDVPRIIQTIVRTGGASFGVVIILVLGFAAIMVRLSLKKDKKR